MYGSPETQTKLEINTSNEMLIPKERSVESDHKLGKLAANQYVSLEDYLKLPYADNVDLQSHLESPETKKKPKTEIIGTNSREMIRLPNGKEKSLATSDLAGETAVAIFATDKKGAHYIYVQNYDNNPKNEQKSTETLTDVLYHDLPEHSVLDRVVILTPVEHDEAGKNTGIPKNEVLTNYLKSIAVQGAGQESNTEIQVQTYEQNPQNRSVTDYDVFLKAEYLTDGTTNVYIGGTVIEPTHKS